MRTNHAIAMLMGTTAVLVAALAGNGQERLGLAGRGDSLRISLLRTPEVQKVLKLSPSQIEKITRLEAESKETKKRFEQATKGEKGKPKAKPGQEPTEEERIAKTARESALDVMERQTDERLEAILDSRQRHPADPDRAPRPGPLRLPDARGHREAGPDARPGPIRSERSSAR